MDIDTVATSYARWAPIYDKTFGAVTQSTRRATVERVNALDASEVLEVGVGTGLALPFYAPDRRVTGIDFSEEMLDKARARVRRQGLGHIARLEQMDARDLAFPDASFDAVVAMHIISVVPDPESVMEEMARVLRPGGRLVITNHFARERGPLARVERGFAPFAHILGWHSDFPVDIVTDTPGLRVVERRQKPPMGLMTFLMLEKL